MTGVLLGMLRNFVQMLLGRDEFRACGGVGYLAESTMYHGLWCGMTGMSAMEFQFSEVLGELGTSY